MSKEQPKRKKALGDGRDSLYEEVHIEVFFNNRWTKYAIAKANMSMHE